MCQFRGGLLHPVAGDLAAQPAGQFGQSLFQGHLRLIAELSEGSSGADLKALSTEAGMYAIREERTTVYQSDFERAAAKILLKERNHMAEPEGLIQQYI